MTDQEKIVTSPTAVKRQEAEATLRTTVADTQTHRGERTESTGRLARRCDGSGRKLIQIIIKYE
jgi:hypothetical protein